MPDIVLNVQGVSKYFGGVRALSNVDLEVREQEILALIGPNGAGKTTLFNCLTGMFAVTEGHITFGANTVPIDGLRPHRRARLGLGRTFQNIRLFGQMTVLENVLVGMHQHGKAGFWQSLIHSPSQRR